MKQLEIEYFFPLTEQIPLDLDFSRCSPHQYYLRAQGIAGSHGPFNTGTVYIGDASTTWTTVSNNIGSPSFTINVDAMPITVISKKKPNFIMRFIYKSMGMKWKSE